MKLKDLKEGDKVIVKNPDCSSWSIPGKVIIRGSKVFFQRDKKEEAEIGPDWEIKSTNQ